jgi:spore coat polysaccharide biosynthesis protein SpsF
MVTTATVIIQARMGSTRLPGKVLKFIGNKPLLSYIIESLKLSPVINDIIIATSKNKDNDAIEEYCKKNKIKYFRGSEENVLERFHETALKYPDKYYFRATADNPILDIKNPEVTLNYLAKNNLDYAAVKKMPIGSIVECFTKEALKKTYIEAKSKKDREHVTLYMKKNEGFKLGYLEAEQEVMFPNMRLTVDFPKDFKRAEKIIKALYKNGIPQFREIVDFVNKSY